MWGKQRPTGAVGRDSRCAVPDSGRRGPARDARFLTHRRSDRCRPPTIGGAAWPPNASANDNLADAHVRVRQDVRSSMVHRWAADYEGMRVGAMTRAEA